MRTCMYCGRELEKGEVCTCSASQARRNAGAKTQNTQNNTQNTEAKSETNTHNSQTSYKTGYAGEDNRFERARNRYRAKRAAKKNAAGSGGFWNSLRQYIFSAVRNPVDTVINPGRIGKSAMLLISAVMGALLWLCMFFIIRGGGAGPFKLLASAMSFGGVEGYKLLGSVGACLLSGALSGIVMFFLYTGIFYLTSRFVMRTRVPYWEFCIRLVTAWVPFTLLCLAGTVLSFLSPITLAALVLGGAAVTAVLTYEALKTEWIAFPPSKVLSAMLLGYFVFFIIMGHLILL